MASSWSGITHATTAHIKATSALTAANQEMEQDGVKVKVDDFAGSAKMDLTVDFTKFVPTATGEIKMRRTFAYPNFAGVLSTAGGIVVTALLDGTIVALDDQTLEELWRVNVGTGFNAPPMTYSVNGKQYVAIASGLYRNARNKLARAPEMKNLSNATMIFVFGL